jgi:hypothetical protein
MREVKTAVILLFTQIVYVLAEPVALTGKDLPRLLGKPVSDLRVLNLSGKAIPFQVDEVTRAGEYVLPMGERPNTAEGDGKFGERDELVFLFEDADIFSGKPCEAAAGVEVIVLSRGTERRTVVALADKSVSMSPKTYIQYDHAAQRVATPYYYAEFAKNRFHFVKAGVTDFKTGEYVDLTNELRVAIHLRTLFGLIPVNYTEDNIVCFARRYKAGPVRLIRRGDFHLNLGLGVKGSKAAVNQICYPQAVKVPVYVNLPVRFRTLFSQAYIEMTPVMRSGGKNFNFTVPSEKLVFSLQGVKTDSLYGVIPIDKLFALRYGDMGYGWLLNTTMPPAHLSGSGFVMRRPPSPERKGVAECGFRLAVRDVPKGSYDITNWVLFSGGAEGDIERLGESISKPVKVEILN